MCPDPSGASAPHSFPLEARFSAAAHAPGRLVFRVLCHHLLPFDLFCPSPQPSPSCSHPSHCLSLNLHSDNSQISAPSLALRTHIQWPACPSCPWSISWAFPAQPIPGWSLPRVLWTGLSQPACYLLPFLRQHLRSIFTTPI